MIKVLDDVFQLEKNTLIVAVRNIDEQVSHYEEISLISGIKETSQFEDSVLIRNYEKSKSPSFLDQCEDEVKKTLLLQGYRLAKQCLVIPFYSPEYLEGLIIMGERSNQAPYTDRDLRFMGRLVSYISAILYRLTPFVKKFTIFYSFRP